MTDRELIERLAALFQGNEAAHGTHGTPTQEPGALKWAIKSTAVTVMGAVTVEMWMKHVSGTRPLGVVPIRNDSTCFWGSIDVDIYDTDHLALIGRVEAAQLPLVPCRSKSGGLHLFLFLAVAMPAGAVQMVLQDWAARLGLSKCEIFPKQTTLLAERGDMGNWMVMPYFGDTYDGRIQEQVGVKRTGSEMTLGEFVAACEEARLTPERFEELGRMRNRAPRPPRGNGATPRLAAVAPPRAPFSNGPPCLEYLAQSGVDNNRNNALFCIGIYCRRSNPDGWEARVEEYNQNMMRPPLGPEEVRATIRSIASKDYDYTCKNEPMASHCNSRLCRTRTFGVGQGGPGGVPVIKQVTRLDTDPPVWFLNIENDDTRYEVSTEQFLSYAKMTQVFLEKGSTVYAPMKQVDWHFAVQDAMLNKEIEVKHEPGGEGETSQFMEVVETMLVNQQRGQGPEDILRGRPWEDEDAGVHCFRLRDLQHALEREGVKLTRSRIAHRLVEGLGGKQETMDIKGKKIKVWKVPAEKIKPDPALPVPDVEGEPM